MNFLFQKCNLIMERIKNVKELQFPKGLSIYFCDNMYENVYKLLQYREMNRKK